MGWRSVRIRTTDTDTRLRVDPSWERASRRSQAHRRTPGFRFAWPRLTASPSTAIWKRRLPRRWRMTPSSGNPGRSTITRFARPAAARIVLGAVPRVAALVGVEQHAQRQAPQAPDAAQRPQRELDHDQRRAGRPDPLPVEPLRVAAEGLVGRGRRPRGRRGGPPGACRRPGPRCVSQVQACGCVGQLLDRLHPQLVEHRCWRAGRACWIPTGSDVRLESSTHSRSRRSIALAPLGHEAHGVGAGVDLPGVQHRRLGGAEVAGAATSTRRLTKPAKSRPTWAGAHQVGAVLAEAGQAVDLEDVELVLRVEAHVDAGAVVAAQGLEGADRDLLGLAGQRLADRRRADAAGWSRPLLAGLVLVGVDLRGRRRSPARTGGNASRRAVAEQADVDLAALDVLLDQHRLRCTRRRSPPRPRGSSSSSLTTFRPNETASFFGLTISG